MTYLSKRVDILIYPTSTPVVIIFGLQFSILTGAWDMVNEDIPNQGY